ncbi:protocadherin-16-like [Salvelinus namaycush]|uniref:Protocadherin-16-like n=1 Tax=Salvelinus namaycush TaxID=8040 RepID=A0A8U0TM84_SALNM|nr:protocadherin-16-like [Salvelinus namaycush]
MTHIGYEFCIPHYLYKTFIGVLVSSENSYPGILNSPYEFWSENSYPGILNSPYEFWSENSYPGILNSPYGFWSENSYPGILNSPYGFWSENSYPGILNSPYEFWSENGYPGILSSPYEFWSENGYPGILSSPYGFRSENGYPGILSSPYGFWSENGYPGILNSPYEFWSENGYPGILSSPYEFWSENGYPGILNSPYEFWSENGYPGILNSPYEFWSENGYPAHAYGFRSENGYPGILSFTYGSGQRMVILCIPQLTFTKFWSENGNPGYLSLTYEFWSENGYPGILNSPYEFWSENGYPGILNSPYEFWSENGYPGILSSPYEFWSENGYPGILSSPYGFRSENGYPGILSSPYGFQSENGYPGILSSPYGFRSENSYPGILSSPYGFWSENGYPGILSSPYGFRSENSYPGILSSPYGFWSENSYPGILSSPYGFRSENGYPGILSSPYGFRSENGYPGILSSPYGFRSENGYPGILSSPYEFWSENSYPGILSSPYEFWSENSYPGILSSPYEFWSENSYPGHSQDISYSISSGDPDGYFTMDSTSGALRSSVPLDHEACPSLDLEVQARYGSPPAYGTTRVRITISDVNDNYPSFLPSSSESLLLPEVTKMGTVVYRVQATDRDSGPNGQLSFDLVSIGTGGSSGQRMFGVDRGSGELKLIGGLNYESVPRYDLQVVAKDGGAPQLSSTFTLVVHVQAQDAQGPAFDTLTYRVELQENTPLKTRFLQVRALNREAAGNGGSSASSSSSSSVSYRLHPDGDAAGFGIAPDSGWLYVRSSLDREAKDMYLLTVLATSGPGGQVRNTAGVAGAGRTGSATVRVSVTDENDNSPRLSQERVFLAVRENLPPGTGFGHVSATDRDAGLNARLTFRLLHTDRHFQINANTGEISTRLSLDREQQSSYQLVVVVQDGGTPPRSATGTAHITVLDENDNAPVFSHAHPDRELLIQVMEESQPDSVLGTVTAKDPDEGENGTIHYSLSGSRVECFSLNPTTGELRYSSSLRHGEMTEYNLTVSASDLGTPPHTSTCPLRIQVLSSSKSSAKNTLSMTLNSVEGVAPGSVIGSVRSHDQSDTLSLDGQVTYVVVDGTDRKGTFMVDRVTGDVYLVRELDYEEGDRYTLHVEVSDFTLAYPSSHRVQLDINVQDSNDHAPQFTEDPVTIVIPENTQPGASIYTFQAADKDGSGPNSELRYSIQHRWPDSLHLLTLDPSTGVLTLGQELDHETTSSLYLVVRATDQAEDVSSRRWGSVTARVFVTDENDNAPVFSSSSAVSVMEDQPVGFVVVYAMARDEDEGENGRVSYSIQSGNSAGRFSLNPNTELLQYAFTELLQCAFTELLQYAFTELLQCAFTELLQYAFTELLQYAFTELLQYAFTELLLYSFTELLQYAFTELLQYAFTELLQYTFTELLRYAFTGLLQYAFTELLQYAFTELLRYSFTELLQYAFTELLQYAFTGLLQYSLTGLLRYAFTELLQYAFTGLLRYAFTGLLRYAFTGLLQYAFTELLQYAFTELLQYAFTELLQYTFTELLQYAFTELLQYIFTELLQYTFTELLQCSLSILKALDREDQEVFNLTIIAEDHGMPQLSTSQVLSVHVIDVNDEPPLFQGEELEAEVRENQEAGTTVITITATDRDQGSNGQVTYGGVTEEGFTINPVTGVISTTKTLDRETQDHYTLTVSARDGGLPPNFAKVVVRVLVQDENDNVPVFARPWYGLEVPESQSPVELCIVRAADADTGPAGDIEYRITAGDPDGDFQLHVSTGALSTSRPLDRELRAGYNLEVVALDRGSPALSSTATVEVTVLDVNDNSPSFSSSSYTVDVSEDAAQGTTVLEVTATDADEGENGKVLYFLSREARGAFTVDENTGRITTASPVDREKRASYSFHVFAVDLSPAEPRNTSAQVTVTILDINDNAPFFIQDPLVVEVSASQSHRVLATMRAEDKDFGANGSVFYRFAGPVRGFSINSLTGEIQGTEGIDRLNQAQRTLMVEAMDQGTPAQSSLGVVVVYVKEQVYTGIRFSRNARDVSIQENAAKGTSVAQDQAEYPDGTRRGISYSLFSGNRLQAFSIGTSTGEIWVQRSLGLDFEDTPRLRLVVKAETASSSSFMAVNLILQDINDNLPRFQLQNYVAYMREAQGYDVPIIQVVAEDVDQGQNGQVTYSIQSSGGMSGLFKINPVTGSITTAAIMDREIWTKTRLVVTATDRGSPRLAGSATLTVIIVDLNDNSPTIPLPREVRIPENTLIGTEITSVTGNDVDSSPALSYSLQLDGSSQGKFGIHRYSGGVSLTAPLDYEDRTWYTLTVRATDSQHQTEANITILVEDVNDNAPAFTHDLYQVTLPEHSPPGSPVVTVTATDRDSGENGKVTYRVTSSTRGGFYVDPSNGTLFIRERAEFDPENPSVSVVIEACDGGSPPLSSVTTVQVQLSDVNDNAPVFHQSEYRATVLEDSIPGATILTLEAMDADFSRDNCGFDFAIANGNTGNVFQIESSVRFLEGRGFQTVGTLLLAEVLDFEAVPLYNLTVVVSDRGVPQRSSSVAAVITVGDVNDNPPAFGRAEYAVSLSEGAGAGTEIIRLTATDPDSAPNAEVKYSISSGDEMDLFMIDQWTGAMRLQRQLDREHQSSHVVIVQATDGHGHVALTPISVEVKDVNDNRPFFPIETLTASIRENQPVNSAVTILHAIDHDTGMYGQLRYYMVERGQGSGITGREAFTVDQSSGEVRAKMTFDFEKVNSFNFVALAMDAGNHSATVTVQVYVTGEDEYDPLFVSPEFSFEVPEGAKRGQSIGQVQANDEDGGVDGIVLFSLPSPSLYFDVNKTTGVVFLKMDGSSSRSSSSGLGGRSKRETRTMTLDVHAHSPLDTSRVTTAQLTIDVTNTSFGLGADLNVLLIIIIAVSLGVVVLLVVMAVVIFLVKSKRRRKNKGRDNSTVASGTTLQKLDDSKSGGSERIYHQTLPGYAGDQGGAGAGPYPRGGSLDPSHSSGRGSAEAAEDDEIRMINEYPRVASISSSMQEHMSARGPDSGIQQDADQLSDISCEPAALEGSTWFKGKKLGGSLSGTMLSGQLPVYRDELGGGYLGVGRGLNISHPKEYAFPEDGKPLVDGSLTAIVASDEELRGSYNWDYLLNWCPQFQPLANVFTEIARLKDETAPQNQTNPRQPLQPKAKTDPKPRIDPPPLITAVAHPGAKSVPPKVPVIGRTFPHLATLRRSPISHEGSISSAAMSPSFSPSLSPLAARSPAVSPFGVTQGPSTSMISTRDPMLDHSPDHEMRI